MSFQPPERKHLGRVHTCLRAAAPARAATSRALWPPGPRGRPGAAWGGRDALQRARPARGRLASDHGVAASSQGSRRGGAPRAVRVFGSCLVSSRSERRTCGLPLAAAVRPPLFRGCGGGGPARAGTTGPARARGTARGRGARLRPRARQPGIRSGYSERVYTMDFMIIENAIQVFYVFSYFFVCLILIREVC